MLTQRTLHQLIADLWTMSASMNAASSTNQLQFFDTPDGGSIMAAPVRPEWLEKGAEALQKAAEDLESLLDDSMPVPKPPSVLQPVLSIVSEKVLEDDPDPEPDLPGAA